MQKVAFKKKKKRNHKSKIVPNWFHGKINISVMIITKLSYIHTMNARFHGKKYKIKAKLSPRFLQKFSQINILLEYSTIYKLIWREKICVAENFSFFHRKQIESNFMYVQQFKLTNFFRRMLCFHEFLRVIITKQVICAFYEWKTHSK